MGSPESKLRGAQFNRVDMTGARFWGVRLSGARFDQVNLSGAVMRGAEPVDVDIDGEIDNLTINGVEVAPLLEAELNRRYPDRAKMRPTDPDGFFEAWEVIERLWDDTVARAQRLAPELLHESVDGEWSFIQTLRHLVFATDAWIRRALLGDPSQWDPLDLPHDTSTELPAVPRDVDARPSLDEVLALRADRMATVRQVLADQPTSGWTTILLDPDRIPPRLLWWRMPRVTRRGTRRHPRSTHERQGVSLTSWPRADREMSPPSACWRTRQSPCDWTSGNRY